MEPDVMPAYTDGSDMAAPSFTPDTEQLEQALESKAMAAAYNDDYLMYTTGPMRGIPEYNYPAFRSLKKYLEEQDYGVLCPCDNYGGDTSLTFAEYLAEDIKMLQKASGICLMPGWERSEGSYIEVAFARELGLDFFEATWQDGVDGWNVYRVPAPELPSRKPGTPAHSPRADMLDEAKGFVTQDRNNSYGPPTQDFRRSADVLTALGYRHTQLPASAPPCPACGARALAAHDTAIAVDAVKTSRLMWMPTKRDSWVDKAGYAACGYECAMTEGDDGN
jgi:hypothetical protein